MVKTKGPFVSLDAAGAFGGTLIAQSNKGRTYLRKLTVPTNPKSAPQLGARSMFRHLTKHWQAISAADQATWNIPAEDQNITPFDAYLRENLTRWGIGEDPGEAYPVAEDDSAGAANLIILILAGRGVQVAFQLSPIDQNQGFRIHRNLSPGIPASPSNLVHIQSPIGSPADSWFDTPKEPDQYWYRLVPFSQHGVTGTPTAELQTTVT